MFFEVSIQNADRQGHDSKLQIQARTWIQALNTGLTHNHIAVRPMTGWYVDVAPDGFRITDPQERRMITIRELDEKARSTSQMLKAFTGSQPAVPAQIQSPHAAHAPAAAPVPAPGAAGSVPTPAPAASGQHVGLTDRSTGRFRAIGAADLSLLRHDAGATGRVIQESRETGSRAAAVERFTADVPAAEKADVSETALEDVFLDIMAIFEPGYAMEDAVDFTIDLALKYIKCDYGFVLFAADSGENLYAAAVRGKDNQKLLDITLPIQLGIPSFTLQHGMALTLVDPASDPRYEGSLAKRLPVKEQSLLCAPIQHSDRAFGVFLLINRQGRAGFTQYDSNIVSYIGSQMGKFIQQQLDAAPL